MRNFKFQVYTTDWDGVKGIYEVHSITLWDERYEKVKVVFRNSSGDIESQVVSKENVRQYTGLEDMNSKEIYEGDIIKAWSTGSCGTFEVRWRQEGSPCFILYPAFQNGEMWRLHGRKDKHGNYYDNVEVVGNIYETPELVKNLTK